MRVKVGASFVGYVSVVELEAAFLDRAGGVVV